MYHSDEELDAWRDICRTCDKFSFITDDFEIHKDRPYEIACSYDHGSIFYDLSRRRVWFYVLPDTILEREVDPKDLEKFILEVSLMYDIQFCVAHKLIEKFKELA